MCAFIYREADICTVFSGLIKMQLSIYFLIIEVAEWKSRVGQ